MSKASSIRKAIYRAIGETTKKETHAAVGKSGVKAKRKGTRGQPLIVGILEENGKHTDIYGRTYKPVEIDGKRLMKRDDGALFKLRRDGRWQHIIPKAKRRKKGLFG